MRTIGIAAWQFKDENLRKITKAEVEKIEGLLLLTNPMVQ
jgi:hypothetical protein